MHKISYATIISIIPKEGEIISVKGGLGNGILNQTTMKDGVILERSSPNETWVKSNLLERINNFLQNKGTKQ